MIKIEGFKDIIEKDIVGRGFPNLENVTYKKLYDFFILFNEKRKVMNLTGLKTEEDIINKMFLDSILIYLYSNKYISKLKDTVYGDLGTGGGFPGLIFRILNNQFNSHLIDSVGKKVNFLEDVIDELDIHNTKGVWGRLEELAFEDSYRESFELITARSLAYLPTLYEYSLPFLKLDGLGLFPKLLEGEEEVQDGMKILKILGGEIRDEIKYNFEDQVRSILVIQKVKNTPISYPRKSGIPKKEPII